MPMPALNIIAIHEIVRNSGRSASRPSGIRPDLLAASQITEMTKADARSTNSQPSLPVTQPRTDALTVPSPVGVAKPQATNPRAMAAATANRTLSTPQWRSATHGGACARAGWVPVTCTYVASAGNGGAPDPAPSAGPIGRDC